MHTTHLIISRHASPSSVSTASNASDGPAASDLLGSPRSLAAAHPATAHFATAHRAINEAKSFDVSMREVNETAASTPANTMVLTDNAMNPYKPVGIHMTPTNTTTFSTSSNHSYRLKCSTYNTIQHIPTKSLPMNNVTKLPFSSN